MQGLIFIPDITGFTNFVQNIDIELGVAITRDLLNELIDKNPLDIQLSEIEGDAILFYKLGKPIGLKPIMDAFTLMSDSFNAKYDSWKYEYGLTPQLSLKLIVHYGNITVYNIRGFKKLYGQPLIESHRLLKNGNSTKDYVLITDDYIKALQKNGEQSYLSDNHFSCYSSHYCSDSKKINYFFFSALPKPQTIKMYEPIMLSGRA